MINPKTLLEIDSQVIDSRNYYDLQVYSSIKNALPILTFKLRDDTGVYWNELNFSVGSVVRFAYVETNLGDKEPNVSYTTKFIIQKLYNGFEINNKETMGGYVQVTCIQAWNYFGDYTSHAYDCQKMSDLIKTICKSAKPGSDIYVADENFTTSTDSGSIRYKSAISDLGFITEKLLPFTMIDSSNALFYVNRIGAVHLSGYNTLYSKSEKLIICPPIAGIPEAENALAMLKTSKNLDIHAEYISITSSIASDPAVYTQLKQKVYIYDMQNESTKIGTQSRAIGLGTDSEKIKKSYTPIKSTIVDDVSATSTFYIGNRPFEEQIAAARNTLAATNNLLSVEVYLGNFFPEVNIGDTVFLWIPPETKNLDEADENGALKQTSKRKTHWLCGKWLISSEAVVTIEQGTVATRFTLVRPAFNFEPETTTLADFHSFFKVK